ncbi:MAG: hypothetical protein IKR93_08315, partial [Firmicutes bacterium]|nr:hypothetical protein [Bacillota bacterium]
MKFGKRLTAIVLSLAMVFVSAPLSFAADQGWTVTFDSSAYGEGTLSVELYEARRGYAPDIKWTRGAGSLRADKTGAQLFGSGDYYAVVQYEAGSSGDPANLSDAQIEAEFDKYWIAMYGSLPVSGEDYPTGYPNWNRQQALAWYGSILENSDFVSWFEDAENEDYGEPLFSAEQFVEYAEDSVYYDPDDPDYDPDEVQAEIDEEIVYGVNEIAEAYLQYSGGGSGAAYYQYDINTKRSIIMSCIQYPQMAPAGYTPPGAGSEDAFVKSVVHLLSSSEKANGLTVGGSFFDACRPLEITPMHVGEKTDSQTHQLVPLYAENAVWRVFGDIAVPAAIRAREQQEESDSVDPISEGLIGNLYGRDTASAALTGLVDTDVPLYVEPGSYLVTAASSASEDTDEPYSVFDWENVTVTNSGGSVSFAGNRSYATLNIEGSVLNAAPSVMSLKVVLSGGDLKSAEVEAELMSYGFDTSTYEYSQTVSPIKVKPGTYGDAMVTCSSSNIDMVGGVMAGEVVFVCSFWEKNGIGTLASGSNTNWSIPKLSKTETNFTASLEFTGANGEEAPFGEGTAVNGRMVLDAGEWKLASAVVMKQEVESMEQYSPLGFDDITVLATRAEYANGILITRAAGDEHTWFSLTAPEESSVVNARSYLNVDGIVDLEFTAAALLDTGVGSGETVELGSAEFSAAAGTLANGYLTLTDSNTGSLRFTYTPEAGQERPASVSVKLVYLDTAGERRNVSAALSGPQTFTGTVDIPEDAAVLESAVFSAPSGNLLTKNLQAIIVLAHASASLDTSGYSLAPEFDALKVIYGRKIYAMPKAGGVFTGLCPRGAYRRMPNGDGMAVFFIENEPFTVGGSLEDFCTGADTFALDTSTLPDKIRVDVLGDFREDEIDASGKFVLADKTVNAYTSSNYFDSEGYHFYLERPASASAAGNIELTAETRGYSYVLTSDVGEATGNGITYTTPFIRGSALSIETDMKVKWLTDYMYMDVLCGSGGTTPAQQDLSFDFYGADGSWVGSGSWYWRTKQLETSFLDSSSRYRLSFNSYGSVAEPFDIDETWIHPVHNGENEADPPAVVLREKAAVIIDALFYSDNEGIPGSGTGAVNLGVDYEVFYKNKATGEWTPLPGKIIHGTQMTGHLDLGLGSYFLSEAVDMSLIDKDSGLKLTFGESANLADMVNFIGGSYHRLGQEVRLVSGQEFYTNPAQGNNGGITTQYITGNETILYPDNVEYYSDYAYTWEFGERAVHGDLESGIIRGLELAQIPRIDLRADRNITPQPITFALRGTDGSFRRFDYNTATMDSGSVDQFTLRDLPYGNYELLTVFNRDAYGEQLISQFADGMDVVVPVTMCASVTNVSFTERDAYASVQLPPPPVDASVPGIQSMTVTSS